MHKGGENRFPATMRLKKRKDFRRVYRSGLVKEGICFSFHILRKEGTTRVGIVVPRRWGTAVERNRMKRLLREAFRHNSMLFAGVNIIIQPHKVCKGRRAEEIEKLLIEEFGVTAGTEESDEERNDLSD